MTKHYVVLVIALGVMSGAQAASKREPVVVVTNPYLLYRPKPPASTRTTEDGTVLTPNPALRATLEPTLKAELVKVFRPEMQRIEKVRIGREGKLTREEQDNHTLDKYSYIVSELWRYGRGTIPKPDCRIELNVVKGNATDAHVEAMRKLLAKALIRLHQMDILPAEALDLGRALAICPAGDRCGASDSGALSAI